MTAETPAPQPTPSQGPPTDSPQVRRIVVAAFSAVLLLPLAMYGCGPEWARWDAAQAVIAYDEGDMEQAIFQLKTAVERSPRDPSLKISLAQKLIESRRGKEAEALCDEVLERFPDNDLALVTKANAQQTQGNFKQALKTFNVRAEARNWLIGNSAPKLNERAYFRALAGTQLEEAKEDIDDAAKMVARYRFGNLPWTLGLFQRSLVASSLIAIKIGMTEEAIDRLSRSIDDLRILLHGSEHELNAAIVNFTVETYPPKLEQSHVHDDFRGSLRAAEQTLATLLSVRALAWQTLEQNDLRDQDRSEVRSLALDADEIVASLPEDNLCMLTIQQTAAYLDTRGFILGLMPIDGATEKLDIEGRDIEVTQTIDDALADLNQSIFAFEVYERSLDSDIHNSAERYIEDIASARKSVGKEKAVLLYHRFVIHQRAGDTLSADADAVAIEALGETPGKHLF